MMEEEFSDFLLHTRVEMLNLKGVLFKPGVHVGVVEDGTIYKAKILTVDWINMQVVVHFLNYNKRYDRAVKMSEVKAWKMDPSKGNEYRRPYSVESPVRDALSTDAFVALASTPNGSGTANGELRCGARELKMSDMKKVQAVR